MRGEEDGSEFDSYAKGYDKLLEDPIRDRFAANSSFYAERKLELVLEFLRNRKVESRRMRWLDVGCGRGELLRMGLPWFGGAAGCDPSGAMLEICRGLDVRRQISAAELPFPDSSFDLVTAVCIYHHVAPPMRLALTSEAARVLKPGGFFCVIEHNPLNPAVRLIVSRTPVDANARLIRAGPMKRLLRSAELEPIGTVYFLYLPAAVYRRFHRLEGRLARIPLGGQYAVFGSKSMPAS